jgi:hypothetical protein
MLLSDGVELVGTGRFCSRAELTPDDSFTLRISVQHAWACTAAASKYERAHTWVVALVDLFRCCAAEVHRESVNHSNVETGRKKAGGGTRVSCVSWARDKHTLRTQWQGCVTCSMLATWRKRIA